MVVQRVVAPCIQVQFLDFTPKDAYSKYSYLQVFDMGLKVLVKYVSCFQAGGEVGESRRTVLGQYKSIIIY